LRSIITTPAILIRISSSGASSTTAAFGILPETISPTALRHRASELVTLELGSQTEIELQRKLTNEIGAERWTRLDRMLIAEQREQGVIDLRPGEGASYLVRENRTNLIDANSPNEAFTRWLMARKDQEDADRRTLAAFWAGTEIVRTW
jgi:hypothetical protein